jgi:hypothetical protein
MSEVIPIAAVMAEADKSLLVTWQDGRMDRVALAGWIATGGEALAPLKEWQLFATARVGEYGADIEWDDEGDLRIDAYHLAQLAIEQSTAFDAAAWQRKIGLSNQEAADFFDVALSTWNAYRAGSSPVPGAVRIAARAALRDPLVVQAHYRPRQAGRPRHRGPMDLVFDPPSKHRGLAEDDPASGAKRRSKRKGSESH